MPGISPDRENLVHPKEASKRIFTLYDSENVEKTFGYDISIISKYFRCNHINKTLQTSKVDNSRVWVSHKPFWGVVLE